MTSLTLLDAAVMLASSPRTPDWVPPAVATLGVLPPGLVDAKQVTAAVRPYMWLMDRCSGDGLPLTQAGRLRPDDVAALMVELGWADQWIGKLNRENQTEPARRLRESAQGLRLVRRHKGRLVVSPAGRQCTGDPMALWTHIAATLPLDRTDNDMLATAARLLSALSRAPEDQNTAVRDALAAVLSRSDGSPLTNSDTWWLGIPTDEVFSVLAEDGLSRMDPALRRALAADVFRNHVQQTRDMQPDRSSTPVPCHTIKVTLREVRPPVWRRVRVPSDIPLTELAEVLISAMGWVGYHLWAFRQGKTSYAIPNEDWPNDDLDAAKYTLAQILPKSGGKAMFAYDFGDGWKHDILVESVEDGPDSEHVLAGRRNCPPEDVGGPWGYEDFLEAMKDPEHPEHEERLDWVGNDFDPEEFDVAECDTDVRLVRSRVQLGIASF